MSGKRPTDHMEPSAKKRGNERQLTKDDESDGEEVVDPGKFARASEDVLKQRKIVRARRGGVTAGGEAKAANPFAGIQLAAGSAGPAANPFAGVSLFGGGGATPAPTPTKPDGGPAEAAAASQPAEPVTGGEQPAGEGQQSAAPAAAAVQDSAKRQDEGEQGAAGEGGAAAAQEAKPAEGKPAATLPAAAASGGFGTLGGSKGGLAFGSSTSGGGLAFGGATGGFGSASGGFGSLASAGSGGAFSFGAASAATTTSSIFSFSAASSSAAAGAGDVAASTADAAAPAPAAIGGTGTSLFGATPASGTPLFGAAPPAAAKVELPEEAALTTGEEDERTVFSGEGALFEFDAAKQWRERGRGEMRVNVASSGQARLVMRQKGNLRLLMNANLWAEMQVSKMEGGKGVTFACINAAGPAEETGKQDEAEGEAGSAAGASAPAAAAPKLATFALRIKAPDVLDQFVAAVNAHKAGSKKATGEEAA